MKSDVCWSFFFIAVIVFYYAKVQSFKKYFQFYTVLHKHAKDRLTDAYSTASSTGTDSRSSTNSDGIMTNLYSSDGKHIYNSASKKMEDCDEDQMALYQKMKNEKLKILKHVVDDYLYVIMASKEEDDKYCAISFLKTS